MTVAIRLGPLPTSVCGKDQTVHHIKVFVDKVDHNPRHEQETTFKQQSFTDIGLFPYETWLYVHVEFYCTHEIKRDYVIDESINTGFGSEHLASVYKRVYISHEHHIYCILCIR